MKTSKIFVSILVIFAAPFAGFYISSSYFNSKSFTDQSSEKITKLFCSREIFRDYSRCAFSRDVNHLVYSASGQSLSSRINQLEEIFNDTLTNMQNTQSNEFEHQTLRNIVLLQTVMGLERYSHSERYEVLPQVTNMLSKFWRHYPEYVAASICIDCGNHSNSLRDLAKTIKTKQGYVNQLIIASTRFLSMMGELPVGEIKNIRNHFRARAELSYSSHGSVISNHLIETKDWDGLRALVNNSGAWAIGDSELSLIPRDIVEQAWIQSVSRGRDHPIVLRYLVQTGYRPALRWLVWQLAGNYQYFRLRPSQIEEKQALLSSSSDFGEFQGKNLAEFYSRNWQEIIWNEKSNRWDSLGKRL